MSLDIEAKIAHIVGARSIGDHRLSEARKAKMKMSKIATTSLPSHKADAMTTPRKLPLFSRSAKDHATPRSPQKSAVTNGTRLLASHSNRSSWARRCKDIMEGLTSDRGGVDNVSAAEASIIRRAAVLSVELELLEVKFAEAGQSTDRDLDLYGRTSGNLRRLLETLDSGLERRAKELNPSTSLNEITQHIDAGHEVEPEILEAQILEPAMADEPASEPAAASYKAMPKWS